MSSPAALESGNGSSPARIIFVTATDTGAGKTLLTAALLIHLRASGCHALAMKPFCSGGGRDVELLSRLQDDELPAGEMNPFCFAEPLAPLVAARKRRQRIDQGDVLARIQRVQSRCECLLIEGSGGLMVPLGEGFFVADVIAALDCDVVVVAQNKLGVINHTLLTSRVLALHGVRRMKIALLARRRADLSARTNSKILAELLAPIRVINLPFLGVGANRADVLKKKHKKLKKTLAEICNFATFCPAL